MVMDIVSRFCHYTETCPLTHSHVNEKTHSEHSRRTQRLLTVHSLTAHDSRRLGKTKTKTRQKDSLTPIVIPLSFPLSLHCLFVAHSLTTNSLLHSHVSLFAPRLTTSLVNSFKISHKLFLVVCCFLFVCAGIVVFLLCAPCTQSCVCCRCLCRA